MAAASIFALRTRSVRAKPRHGPRLIVVAPEQGVPIDCLLPAHEKLLEFFQVDRDHIPFAVSAVEIHTIKLEQQIQLPAVADNGVCILRRYEGRFAHAHAVSSIKAAAAHFPQILVQLRLKCELLRRKHIPVALPVRQTGRLCNQTDHVHPEAVYAAVKPAIHHGIDRFPELWIFPVQIRLLLAEQMPVPLSGFFHRNSMPTA